MTRKQAITKAIQAVSESGLEESNDIIGLLQDIYDELPINHWTDKSIRDSVEQFIIDNGRNPTATDFKKRGMPPHPVIKQKYKVTLSEWLENNYPTQNLNFDELKNKYTNAFVEDYLRIKPKSSDEFNRKKSADTKCWQTVAKYYDVKSWLPLLSVLNLPHYEADNCKKPVHINVNIESNI